MRRRLNVVVLLVMVTAGPVDAQIASDGTVRGVVRDTGGGVLPGVTVTAVSPTAPGTHISVSESDGQYRLLNLPPGVFDIVAELAGFAKYTRQGVEARAGVNLTLDIVLALGSLDESITVRGESPLLETPQKQISLGHGALERRLQQLIDLVPAVGVHSHSRRSAPRRAPGQRVQGIVEGREIIGAIGAHDGFGIERHML